MTGDSSGLAGRLRRIQGELKRASAVQPPATNGPGHQSVDPAGRRIESSSSGPSKNRSSSRAPEALLPGWERAARLLWTRTTDIPNPLSGSRPLRLLTPEVDDDRNLCFVDTETTGLSGGAGTIAFLVGIGVPQGDVFRVTQYFVADYPGERDLIEMLARELDENRVVVSYNGKSFDVPILRSRFALNGRSLRLGAQIDLLHTARRLWRASIGTCSLHAVEEQVLGVEREDDVPGYLVPELYFEYLRSGDASDLHSVFSHHFYDIVSLATLLDYIETIPSRSAESVDRDELGRLMLERGISGGVSLLLDRAIAGSLSAARVVSVFLKREGRWGEAIEIWQSLWERSSSYFAGVELAKFYEHRSRDLEKALEYVDGISALPLRGTPWAAAARADTARRRERLLRKLARSAVEAGLEPPARPPK